MKKRSPSRRTLSMINDALISALESGQLHDSLYVQLVDLGIDDRRRAAEEPTQEPEPAVCEEPIQEPEPAICEEPIHEPEPAIAEELAPEPEADTAEILTPEPEPASPLEPEPELTPTAGSSTELAIEPYNATSKDRRSNACQTFTYQEAEAYHGPDENGLEEVVEAGQPVEIIPLAEEDLDEARRVAVTSQQAASRGGGKTWSHLFTWCKSCLRVDACVSNTRSLPDELVAKTGDKDGIVLIDCRTCKVTENRDSMPRPPPPLQSHKYGWQSQGSVAPTVEPFRINAKAWLGTEVSRIAQEMTGREVVVITNKNGITAQAKAHELFQNLRIGERAFSIDVERFRKGERSGLELSYVEGGLW